MRNSKKSPWSWIPTLYLIQGLPYVAVMFVSVILYKRLGMSNTDIALYTSWLYLPWVIKPLWSPFVDLFKTKRWWIVTMQLLCGAAFAGIAFTIPAPFFVQATLAFFWLLAFSSATHDIAADGFYMLSLDDSSQAKYVGIRSTFYRCATIFGQGILVMFAGLLESATGLTPVQINVEASPQYTQSSRFIEDNHFITAQEGKLHFITSIDADTLRIGTANIHKDSLNVFLGEIARLNQERNVSKEENDTINIKGTLRFVTNVDTLKIESFSIHKDNLNKFLTEIKRLKQKNVNKFVNNNEVNGATIDKRVLHFDTNDTTFQIETFSVNQNSLKAFSIDIKKLKKEERFVKKEGWWKTNVGGFWTANVSEPLGEWIQNTFGRPKVEDVSTMAGNVGFAAVWLSKSPDPGKEVVLDTSIKGRVNNMSLISGDRLVFNEENWNKPAYLVFQLDRKLDTVSTSQFRGLSGNIKVSWSITFFVLAGLLIFFSFYHKFALPKPDSDKPTANVSANTILKDFSSTFVSFFKKKHVGTALFFILTYRFAEAQALKLLSPMLLDSPDVGGLGLTTGQVGLAYGTFGIAALTIGGIIGGIVASRGGLKKWLWPMAMALLLPTFFYLYLAVEQPESFFIINVCIFLEQLGYGFGFTAFMLYMIYFSQGEHKTAHYAICTGFMALGMMVPGMFAGWLQELIGYDRFFIWVMICSIIPVIAVALLKIDPNFGKAKTN